MIFNRWVNLCRVKLNSILQPIIPSISKLTLIVFIGVSSYVLYRDRDPKRVPYRPNPLLHGNETYQRLLKIFLSQRILLFQRLSLKII